MNQNEAMNRLIRGQHIEEEVSGASRPPKGSSVDGGRHDHVPWPARSPHEEANEALRDALHEWWRGRRL